MAQKYHWWAITILLKKHRALFEGTRFEMSTTAKATIIISFPNKNIPYKVLDKELQKTLEVATNFNFQKDIIIENSMYLGHMTKQEFRS